MPPPPPPPGMEGAFGFINLKPPILDRNFEKKLRKIFLTKVPPPKINESIWKDVYDAESFPVNGDLLDELFENKSVANSQPVINKPKVVSLIDPGKTRNFSIIMSQVKKDKQEIIEEIKVGKWENYDIGF